MIICIREFSEVRELERIQETFGFVGGAENVAEALSAPWTRPRITAHLAVFNATFDCAPQEFAQQYAAPQTLEDALALAEANEFDLLSRDKKPLRDWYWWAAMVGICRAGHTPKKRDAIERKYTQLWERRLGDQAWVSVNDRRRRGAIQDE